ncbi:MAG TPA: DUF1285 domain-containing protein [Alphaproteobacteria bacterium]|nr:DUF1285 domain-containing protein [Alphaproteobacteria bacterium]
MKSARRAPTADDEAYDIHISRDGTWFHEGTPIRRIELVKLFATVLRRDEKGEYWLITPAERGRITVEDAPFTAVEMSVSGADEDQVLRFRTNLDHEIEAGPEHPIRLAFEPDTGEPSPYIGVKDNLEALIVRPVYYDLADLATEWNGRLGVWSKGTFFPLDQQP